MMRTLLTLWLVVLVTLDCLTHGKKSHFKLRHSIGRRSKVTNDSINALHNITSSANTTNVDKKTSKNILTNSTTNTTVSERNSKTENAEKKSVPKKELKKDMSAIVVIGNKTRRISGPVVKQLLSELQKQNDVDNQRQKKIEIGESGSSNLKRLYAANEVAEINKLLGKPLTDAKALSLIKNLLLDRVHTHLAKTMESEVGDQNTIGTLQEDLNAAQLGQVQLSAVQPQAAPVPLQRPVCRDLDPKEKCQYLKDVGLCAEARKHPHIGRRCQQTCSMCDACADCNGGCPGCTTIHGWKVDIHIPMEVLKGEPGHPCPEHCKMGGRTTVMPTNHPHTTPNPVFILSDNTPLPGNVLPNAMPTMRTTYPPECEDPTNCPLHSTPTRLPAAILQTTIHLPHHHTTPKVRLPTLHHTTHRLNLMQQLEGHPTAQAAGVPTVPTLQVEAINGHTVGTHPQLGLPIEKNPTLTQIHPSIHIPSLNPTGHPSAAPPLIPTGQLPALPNLINPTGHPTGFHHTPSPTVNPVEQIRLPAVPPGSTAAVFSADGKCQLPLDIGIAIDTSAATVQHWPKIQQFVNELINKFQLGPISRIGLLTFDTLAKVQVPLGAIPDVNRLRERVNTLRPDPYGRRRTDQALELASSRLFTTGRAGIPKILYVLEHGKNNGGDPSIDWRQMLIEPSQRLRSMGVNVFAIGATPVATIDELKMISSSQDLTHVIPLTSYKQLPAMVQQVATKACKLAEKHPVTIQPTGIPPPTHGGWKLLATLKPIDYNYDLSQLQNKLPIHEAKLTSSVYGIDVTALPLKSHTTQSIQHNQYRVTPIPPTAGEFGPYGCKVNFVKIGCFQDDQNNPRPLPEQLLSDTGIMHEEGVIDWNAFYPQFVCRCAILAKDKTYKVFGIQNYASCWSGPNGADTYMEDGESDMDMCVSTDYRTCQAADPVCVGKRETNFVFTLDVES